MTCLFDQTVLIGDIEESGHRREVERRVNVWNRPPKKKMARCIEVTVKGEVAVSSKVRLNIT